MRGSDDGNKGAGGSTSGTGKRRRDRCRDWAASEGAGGFGCSDEVKQRDYKGVVDRRVVEIESLVEGVGFSHDVTGMSKEEAAMVHDLAWVYANCPDQFDVLRLNIRTLVGEVFGPMLSIDKLKEFLIDYVLNHPLKEVVRANAKEWVDSVKDDIVALAPDAFQALKKWIAVELSRAGRQKQDKAEILPAVEEDYLPDDLEEENHHLKKAKEADEFKLQSLMIMLCAPSGSPDPELTLTDLNKHLLKEIQRLEALNEAKDAEITSLKEAKDAQ
ncbi:hypothetical protein KC19_2G274200 [Ceratodon purpureus]|uniref:Uncharacterized protein n=1 Tax=Ceratodon purpureus TaxID=3225 RepID=A0A8T0J1V1_CERPU|nr:hypothetical protein KC19_2G274200 [Ceratodon purpureus]